MRLFLKNIEVINAKSPFNGQKVDMLIKDGLVSEINPQKVGKVDQTIEAEGFKMSTSWIDMRVFSGEPGEEYREDLDSIAEVLKNGGFGHALLMPNTNPVIQQKADIKAILAKNKDQIVDLLPAAAISKDCLGEDINEMLDLHHAGASAFTDGSESLWNSDLMVKTLLYLQKFNGALINFPQDRNLALFGQMNEGPVSTGLGMKGIPNVAEEVMIQRDLELLRYAGGKIHFSCISTEKSVSLIKLAKKEGLAVTCDVNIHHLILDDSALSNFDTNFKVLPPLRSKQDKKALIKGINEGIIDVIVSGHQPYDEDHKKMEFDLAAFGIMGAQIMYPLYYKYLSSAINLNTFINCITINPERILDIPERVIEVNASVDFTIFSEDASWTFDANTNQSKSKNSPFIGEAFKADAVGLLKHSSVFFKDYLNKK